MKKVKKTSVIVIALAGSKERFEVVKCPCSPTTDGLKVISFKAGLVDHSPCLCQAELGEFFDEPLIKLDPKEDPANLRRLAYRLWDWKKGRRLIVFGDGSTTIESSLIFERESPTSGSIDIRNRK